MTIYQIKTDDGEIADQVPIDGAWYCHMVIRDENNHVSGNIAQCIHSIDWDGNTRIEWLDDDGTEVDMFSDDLPDYLVKQH